jgi:hypothetical protein
VRSLRPSKRSYKLRPVAQKETIHWLQLRAQVREVFSQHAPDTTRITLLDSGADAWAVYLDMHEHDGGKAEYSVVRASHNRCVRDASGAESNLWSTLRRAPLGTRYRENIGAGHGRTPRRALFELRTARVTLDLNCKPGGGHRDVPVYAVWLRELGRIPQGQERLEWMLLTSWPIETIADARRVVGWYLKRWRIEDHHKAWKGSGSNIEKTALRSRAAIERWMTIHAAVSARALQLIHAARDPEQAQKPATEVFSQWEIHGLRALRSGFNRSTPDDLNVEQAVTMVAEQGGFVPQKGRRPGPKVLQRGLERVGVAADAIERYETARSSRKLRPK